MSVCKDPIHEAEIRKQRSERMKGKKQSPELVEKRIAPIRGRKTPEEIKQKISQTMKGRKLPWYDKVRAAKKAHPLKGEDSPFYGKEVSSETREKIRQSLLGHKHKKETIDKMCEMRKLDKHPNWMGGKSFEPYCPKFNKEFKERVRAYFDYTCPECLSPQNGTALHVHHINFNKMSCCDDTLPLFIPLCTPCHTKTNFNREYWEQYFIEMIDGYYQGKCYFSKEEMMSVNY